MDFAGNFNLKNTLNIYKDMLFKSKKYWLIYLVLVLIFGLTTANKKNLIHPEFAILTFIIVAILGIFCIVFYFLHNKIIDTKSKIYTI